MRIYGPVDSWKLGNSLGVDLVEVPQGYSKICSYDCVYCQLGHNCFKTDTPQRMPLPNEEFETLRKRIEETNPDYVTFSGNGEPTLNLNLGYAARKIKEMTNIPVAVLTNASFVYDKEVREGLEFCDFVIPKIDAPNQHLFEKINHPYKGISLTDIIEGIKLLKTRVAIQTLLFSYDGLTNADEDTIKGLIEVYRDINSTKPISIFLGTAHRPSGTEGVDIISENKLREIASRINEQTGIKVKYYKKEQVKTVSGDIEPSKLEEELLKLLKIRPCTEEDISACFGGADVSSMISSLVERGILEEKLKGKERFYIKK